MHKVTKRWTRQQREPPKGDERIFDCLRPHSLTNYLPELTSHDVFLSDPHMKDNA